jgi:hypothetical protein
MDASYCMLFLARDKKDGITICSDDCDLTGGNRICPFATQLKDTNGVMVVPTVQIPTPQCPYLNPKRTLRE